MSRPPIFLRGRVERIGSFELNGESFLALSFRAETTPSALAAELSWIRASRSALGDEESFALSLAKAGDIIEAFVEPSPDDARTLVSPDADARATAPQNLVALSFPDIAPIPSHFTLTRDTVKSLESAQSLDEAIEGESAGEAAHYSFGFPAAQSSPAPARAHRVVPHALVSQMPAKPSLRLPTTDRSATQATFSSEPPPSESDFDAQTQAWQADSVSRRVYAEALSQILSEIDSEAWKQKALARILWRQGLNLFTLAAEGKTHEASAMAAEMAQGFRSLDSELTDRSSARRAHALMDAAFRWAGSESRPKDGESVSRLAAAGDFMPSRARIPSPFETQGPALASLGHEGGSPVFSTPAMLLPLIDDSAFSGSEFALSAPRSAKPMVSQSTSASMSAASLRPGQATELAHRQPIEASESTPESGMESIEPAAVESLPSLDDLLDPAPVFLISQRDAAELQLHDESALDELLALAERDPDPLSLAQTQLEDPSWGGAVERFVSEHAPEILDAEQSQPDPVPSRRARPLPTTRAAAPALRLAPSGPSGPLAGLAAVVFIQAAPARDDAGAEGRQPETESFPNADEADEKSDDFSQPSRPPLAPIARDDRSAANYTE